MRRIQGHLVPVNGRSVYVEESGRGDDRVVFDAGAGAGRTSWDPVLPLLADVARIVTYDRAGRPRSGAASVPLGIDDMADDLVALTEAVVPARFVLVAHSMGGLVARRAAERLGDRLRGLVLVDPTPETAPIYDHWEQTVAKTDRMLATAQALSKVPMLRNLFVGSVRRDYPSDTWKAILDEDVTPRGFAQTRREIRAVADAIPAFRLDPPRPPRCPVIVLAASRPTRQRSHEITVVASTQEHGRRYAESLTHGRFEGVESTHLMQAEQPQAIAGAVRRLLRDADATA